MKSLIGIIHLVLCVLAILDIVKSNKETGKKVIWVLVTLLIPLIGPVIYFAVGKKQ